MLLQLSVWFIYYRYTLFQILGLTSSRQLSMKKKFRYRKKNGLHDVEDEMTSLLLTIKHCYRLDVIEKMIAMGIYKNIIYVQLNTQNVN